MRKRLFYIAGLTLLITLASCIWLQHVTDADEIARLRRYSPHGHHFVDTTLTGGKVKWTSKEIMI